MTPTPRARELVGAAVRSARHRRSLSIEAAAKAGGVGHMTWRKIEHGKSVHDQSYYAVDRAFGWSTGHTLTAFDADDVTDALESAESDATTDPTSDPDFEAKAAPDALQNLARRFSNSPMTQVAESVNRKQQFLELLTRQQSERKSDARSLSDRLYLDSSHGKQRIDTNLRFHDEFYVILDLLHRLNVSEIRGVQENCAQIETETQGTIDEIRHTLESAKELYDRDALTESVQYVGDKHTRFNEAYHRHITAYHSTIEAVVELYEMSNTAVGDLSLDDFASKASGLYNELQTTANELEAIRHESDVAQERTE